MCSPFTQCILKCNPQRVGCAISGIILIQSGDNILVDFSGHGSSYDTKSFFETRVSFLGSIKAICLSGRSAGWEISDVSDRKLNFVLSEVRDAK